MAERTSLGDAELNREGRARVNAPEGLPRRAESLAITTGGRHG